MSYPKLWGGPHPVGEAKVRQLQQLDMPFLRASGPGFEAEQTDGKWAVTAGESEPFLVSGYYPVGAGHNHRLTAGNPRTKRRKALPWVTGALQETPAIRTHVGDGWVLGLGQVFDGSTANVQHWCFAVLNNAKTRSGDVVDDTDPLEARKRATVAFGSNAMYYYPDGASVTPGGLTELSVFGARNLSELSVYGSGYDATIGAYRFGWRAFHRRVRDVFDPSVVTHTNIPMAFRGDTATLALDSAPMAYFANRFNHGTPVQSAGPGALAYVLLVQDSEPQSVSLGPPRLDTLYAYSPPYLCVSQDHGASWAAEPLTVLEPYIAMTTQSGQYSRSARHYFTEQEMARHFEVHYVGAGVNLLVAHYCVNNGTSTPSPTNADYRSFLFRRNANGSYERLAWPLDAWTYTQVAIHKGAIGRGCFGEGCLAVTVLPPGGSRCVMFTRDFGATWQFGPALPSDAWDQACVVRPYRGADARGEIYFTYPSNDVAAESPKPGIYGYRTDGDFAEFKAVGRLVPCRAGEQIATLVGGGGIDPQLNTGFTPTYVGELRMTSPRYAPYVNPALPGEFDR